MADTVCSITVKTNKDIDLLRGFRLAENLVIDADGFCGKEYTVADSFAMDDAEAGSIVAQLAEKIPGIRAYFLTVYLNSGENVIHYHDGKQSGTFEFDDEETFDLLTDHIIGSKEWVASFKKAVADRKKQSAKLKTVTCDSRRLTYQINWNTEQTPEEAIGMYYYTEWDGHPEKIRKIMFQEDFAEYSRGYFTEIEAGFTALEEFEVAEDNPVFKSDRGILYSKDLSELIQYPPRRRGKSFVLPEGTTVINETAFRNNPYLQRVVLPNPIETYSVKWEDRHGDMLRLEGAPAELEYHQTALSEFGGFDGIEFVSQKAA